MSLRNVIKNLNEKELSKQARIEKIRRIKEENVLAKQTRIEEKRRLKEEQELAKEVILEEKKRKLKVKKDKSRKKKIVKTDTYSSQKKIALNKNSEFNELVEKIIKKNMNKSYPNINDMPN